ncbi:MAG: cysteine--tRNA ligase [Microthrixaceae bacterium]
MLSLFDTAAGAVRPLVPRDEGRVSMYVCGPTVYGPPHLGHGRFSLVFDVLRRYLRWSGLEVTYVSNITDIDDAIIKRSNEERRDWREITAECEALWWEAMDAIGVMRPDHTPHATGFVDRMVEFTGDLLGRGAAHERDDGVEVRSTVVDAYGLLSRQSRESLQAGARIEVIEGKESPTDFVLWKKAKPGEPSWPSPWGEGRPGWHTECVVMSLDLLGEGFDLHGGGQDLAFPHHENERAQALAAGSRSASMWVHNGFVEVAGEKMAKSLGNFTNLIDLVERVDPRSYRLLCLQAHYRSPIDVNESTTAQASAALDRLDALGRRIVDIGLEAEPDAATLARFRERMDDDLNTAGAMAVVADTVTRINRLLDAGDTRAAEGPASALRSMLTAVGLELRTDGNDVPADVADRCAARDAARGARDWAAADAIRDELVALGWVVEDTPTGTAVRRA